VKQLIVTGDDFGLALPVNEAIEEAHRRGILTTASLMVSAAAAADAVERSRKSPSLRVGLHLVLVEGRPVLPPESVPDLVDEKGEFTNRLVRAGVRYFFLQGVRKQLELEIRAQFEAFGKTGLPLDHVNAHNHLHLHPTILNLILKAGGEHGLKAIRLPFEPPFLSWRASRKSLVSRLATGLFLRPWTTHMRSRLTRARVHFNDYIFGLLDSGAMTAERTLRILSRLPEGVTEIYFHPATRRCPEIDRTMPEYRHEQEYAALISPAVKLALEKLGVRRIAFSDL
jgi:hopanoid biosynthesis associated protein HpnK